jgi:hypothetical protein
MAYEKEMPKRRSGTSVKAEREEVGDTVHLQSF